MIAAIIVTYNPEQPRLHRLLERCLLQVDAILIVDNGSLTPVKEWVEKGGYPHTTWIPLAKNNGIAAAHNLGIEKAKAMGADYVVIFDHDSVPFPDMVARLQAALHKKQGEGYRVAAVGPRYQDTRRQTPAPFIRIEGLRLVRCSFSEDTPIVPVDYLISSGSLIPMATLDDVGGMEDRLFIDYVDIEWGLRAKVKGYQCFGVFDADMEHALGEAPLEILGHKLPLHSPLRHYYIFRNAVWLYKQKNIPLNWKLVDGSRFILRYFCYALFAKPRLAHIQNMTAGIWDGLRERMGEKHP